MSFFDKFSKEIDKIKDKILDKDDPYKQARADPQAQYGGQPYQPYQQSYGVAPPPPGPQPGAPPLPPGWVAQWDGNSQRWYYLEQATGRTQWELPAHQPYPGHGAPPGAPPLAHQGYPSYPGGGQYAYPYPAQGEQKEKSSSKMGIAAGAVGGLAAGGLIGAALASDSDSDHDGAHQPSAFAPAASSADPYDPSSYVSAPPPAAAALPDETASGSSVSSSDREDVEEARREYEEAIRDGDSASDIEEKREEFEEEFEETYDD